MKTNLNQSPFSIQISACILCKKRASQVLIILAFLLFSSTSGIAQKSILSAGQHVSDANCSLNYSIGELSVQTLKQPGAILTQGQQQSNFIITNFYIPQNPKLILKAYPNPTSNYLILEVSKGNFSVLYYSITNVTGQTLTLQQEFSNTESIQMSNYKSGIYFLTVSNEHEQLIQTFKIIKR